MALIGFDISRKQLLPPSSSEDSHYGAIPAHIWFKLRRLRLIKDYKYNAVLVQSRTRKAGKAWNQYHLVGTTRTLLVSVMIDRDDSATHINILVVDRKTAATFSGYILRFCIIN